MRIEEVSKQKMGVRWLILTTACGPKPTEYIYNDFRRYLRGVYVNNVDSSLTNWADQYYRGNLPRLQEVKAAVNPQELE